MGAGAKPGDQQANIVLFSGGTACRTINLALSRRGYTLTRIVPAWDSGGSSKVLRETFGMIPVGDIRQAMMTMAHGEGRAGAIVRICNSRLSGDLGQAELRAEFDYYVSGKHPLIAGLPDEMRDAILGYLHIFSARAGASFDLRNGSVGNFVLAGAYFANDRDIGRAIAAFRDLCSIEGNVWPASVSDDVQLAGTLNDGRRVEAQHLLTSLSESDAAVGIADIALRRMSSPDGVAANPLALEAIGSADLIVFGPGSFYSSILPHLLVDGIAEAVEANKRAARLLIGNILECPETKSATLGGLLETFLQRMPGLTHVLANRELFPFEKKVGRFAYLRSGALQDVCAKHEIADAVGDFEDAWTRGQHDGDAVADAIAAILQDRKKAA